MQKLLRILLLVFVSFSANACVWDAQSLSTEKTRSHDLAQTILGESQTQANTNQLRATLKELESNRKESDVAWWNNLAGTYLRLNQPQDAVNLLEPVVAKFPEDYGIHANLGTAYHLLGRYQDAEKEIARDLQINPDAHFGLEKYHLALLQYLVRDEKYKSRHVYVDELTGSFLATSDGRFDPYYFEGMLDGLADKYENNAVKAEQDYQSLIATNASKSSTRRMLAGIALMDPPPAYRTNLDLWRNANLEPGVIYMAQMNPKEPACFVMLGIVAWQKLDYHLATNAFGKAIVLGSAQSDLLKERVADVEQFIHESESRKHTMIFVLIFGAAVLLSMVFGIGWLIRKAFRV